MFWCSYVEVTVVGKGEDELNQLPLSKYYLPLWVSVSVCGGRLEMEDDKAIMP